MNFFCRQCGGINWYLIFVCKRQAWSHPHEQYYYAEKWSVTGHI